MYQCGGLVGDSILMTFTNTFTSSNLTNGTVDSSFFNLDRRQRGAIIGYSSGHSIYDNVYWNNWTWTIDKCTEDNKDCEYTVAIENDESYFYDITNSEYDHRSKTFSTITGSNFAVEVQDAKAGYNYFCFDCYYSEATPLTVSAGDVENRFYNSITEQYESIVLVGRTTTFNLTFTSVNNSTITNIVANLTWNGTAYNNITPTTSGNNWNL